MMIGWFPVQLGSRYGEPYLHYLPEILSLGGNNISVPLHSLNPYTMSVKPGTKLPDLKEKVQLGSVSLDFYSFTFKTTYSSCQQN